MRIGATMLIVGRATNIVPLTAAVVRELCGEAGKVRGNISLCSNVWDGERHPALPSTIFMPDPQPKSGKYYRSVFWHTEFEKRIVMRGGNTRVELSVLQNISQAYEIFQVRYLKDFVLLEDAGFTSDPPLTFSYMPDRAFVLTMTRPELDPEFVQRALKVGVGAPFWRNGDYPNGEITERYRFEFVFELAAGIVAANDDVAEGGAQGFAAPGHSVLVLFDLHQYELCHELPGAIVHPKDNVLEIPIQDLRWNDSNIRFQPVYEAVKKSVCRRGLQTPPAFSDEPLQIVWKRYSHLLPKN